MTNDHEPTIDSVPEDFSSRSAVAAGDLLASRFVLQDRLGQGGTGVVWSALDTRVGDRVAVKVLDASMRDPANRERLRREIRASRSGHPNLVCVHEVHEADGLLFLTMELVDGPSLRDALAERGSLVVDDVVRIGRQIADALDHLHVQGLVHRDVKPGNIVIDPRGAAKLCDMGLARPVAPGATVTESRMVVGTPTYMAPEMARSGELVAESDVYALGLTLYQCLTGEVPLAKTTAIDTLMARQKQRPRGVRRLRPSAPRWLERLLGRMLDPDPGLRPTAADVSRAFERGRFAWRPTRRHLGWSAAAAAVLLAVVGAALAGRELVGGPPDPADDPVANELMATVEDFDTGTVVTVTDGDGRLVRKLTSNAPRNVEKERLFRNRRVAFADVDGDGRRDIVFADRDLLAAKQIEIHRRLADGGSELAASWNLHHKVVYEDQVFDSFAPADIECADLSGEGRSEIVVVANSRPYYLGEVRVFRPDGQEVLRVLHPGQLANVRTADRDRDGRPEIYAAGTNNFHEQNVGNESSPVVFAVEADWSVTNQVLDLFGPGRTMAPRVPPGMEVVYISMVNQRFVPPETPWRFAAIAEVAEFSGVRFLVVQTDRVFWKAAAKQSFLRSFVFDRDLSLDDRVWIISPLKERGIDPARAEPGEFTVTYWNGAAWQPEPCQVPQAN